MSESSNKSLGKVKSFDVHNRNCLALLWLRTGVLYFLYWCWISLASAAQFFAFFAKTKDGRAKDFSRKMRCEQFAKKRQKTAKIWPKIDLKIALSALFEYQLGSILSFTK